MADQAPPEDVQESNTGSTAGGDNASTSSGSAPEFPNRLRVHALAKLLGVTSKEVLSKLAELGIEARSVQSSLGRDVAETVHAAFNGTAPASSTPAVEQETTAQPAAPETVDDTTSPDSSAETGLFAPPVAPPVVAAPNVGVPLFLQPEVPTEPAPRRRRARKVATSDSDSATAEAAVVADEPKAGAKRARPSRAQIAAEKKAAAADPATDGESTVDDITSVESTAVAPGLDAPGLDAPGLDAPGSDVREPGADDSVDVPADSIDTSDTADSSDDDRQDSDDNDDQSQPRRRRRGRRGRGRGRGEQSADGSDDSDDSSEEPRGADASASDGRADAPVSDRAKSDSFKSDFFKSDSSRVDSSAADSSAADSSRADSSHADELKSSATETDATAGDDTESGTKSDDAASDGTDAGEGRSSGGRRRRRTRTRTNDRSDEEKSDSDDNSEDDSADTSDADADGDQGDDDGGDGSSRRRRRRRRRKTGGESSADGTETEDDPPNTVVHEREPRNKNRAGRDEVQGITGSTRLEAKRQRRRDGRDAGRRRPPILTESEFLARRESVDRVMVVREKMLPEHGLTTQVAVLEDGVLVEHFVTSSASASMVGNVYLGRVQNVLPSMEAAFIDIGRGRNGVLYAGEVNWDAAGLGGNSRKIEQALKPGDQVLVQVSKDPVGHKGARLTTQLSLAGRFLVYVPGGSSTGISRKLPDTERKRLKEILRDIVPPEAGVIIRTAAEGVSEEELARDVARLQAQWAGIEEASAGADTGKGSQPQALYEEPDMLVKVIRDLFNEDFVKLVIEGDKSWSTTSSYIETVAADMLPRLERFESQPGKPDVFEAHRIDEQLAKALDRKVWLPSGGTLVIDRTEAMTVVDVNTGKFTGAGGNLEETVTRNNLEAAEEVVRQMRLRDIGGMIVVDFIDMVLESNRDLVLRRLTEALGRDRTRHQVSEVTSLGLVQMTRKKLGTGLVEAFSTTCEHCQGRGIIVHPFPVEAKPVEDGNRSSSSRGESSGSSRKRRGRGDKPDVSSSPTQEIAPAEQHAPGVDPSVKRAHPVALAMAAHHDDVVADVSPAVVTSGDGTESQVVAASVVDGTAVDSTVVDSAGVDVSVGDASTPAVAADAGGAEQARADTAAPDAESAERGTVNAESPSGTGDAAPVAVKARRGRRVARKAAAPTGEASDAGTVFVVPTPTEPPAVVRAVAEPAVVESPSEQVAEPVARPRRRRAAARPAGPPVDAEV